MKWRIKRALYEGVFIHRGIRYGFRLTTTITLGALKPTISSHALSVRKGPTNIYITRIYISLKVFAHRRLYGIYTRVKFPKILKSLTPVNKMGYTYCVRATNIALTNLLLRSVECQ